MKEKELYIYKNDGGESMKKEAMTWHDTLNIVHVLI